MGEEMKQNLELKYCERCGGLGLRRRDSGQIYCNACEEKMALMYKAPRKQRVRSKRVEEERDKLQALPAFEQATEDRQQGRRCE